MAPELDAGSFIDPPEGAGPSPDEADGVVGSAGDAVAVRVPVAARSRRGRAELGPASAPFGAAWPLACAFARLLAGAIRG
ncbi:MAG TPA: hypothetical protein VE817_02145, partial [Candidatus Acidoferrum sp.]|nr:hypothetical protein [Candidatus Acidoferrum sp.]